MHMEPLRLHSVIKIFVRNCVLKKSEVKKKIDLFAYLYSIDKKITNNIYFFFLNFLFFAKSVSKEEI